MTEFYSFKILFGQALYGQNSIGNSFASVFKERFGIKLDVTFTYTAFQSYSYKENCLYKEYDYIDRTCSDCKKVGSGTDWLDCKNGLHHKSSKWVLAGLSNKNSLMDASFTTILYTGHIECDYTGTSHLPKTGYGETDFDGNTAVIYTEMMDNDVKKGRLDGIIRTTVHEYLHMFSVNHCKDIEVQCIMVNNTLEINSNISMCNICVQTVNNNKLKLYKMSKEQ